MQAKKIKGRIAMIKQEENKVWIKINEMKNKLKYSIQAKEIRQSSRDRVRITRKKL